MNRRPYRSPRRAAAAKQTRERIVAAAGELLASTDEIGSFSLEAVARRAGVTRLTVYNQFGSRRALLEAVFDERAIAGGLSGLIDAMTDPDPLGGVRRVVEIFCNFWSSDIAGLSRLHAAGMNDPEFAASVNARNERRRSLLTALINRMPGAANLRSRERSDLVDVLFALTSFTFFAQLARKGRKADQICRLIQRLVTDAIQAAGLNPADGSA